MLSTFEISAILYCVVALFVVRMSCSIYFAIGRFSVDLFKQMDKVGYVTHNSACHKHYEIRKNIYEYFFFLLELKCGLFVYLLSNFDWIFN